MAGDGAVEGLAIGKATEVEGGAPAILVDISGKIVVAVEKISPQPWTGETAKGPNKRTVSSK